MPRTVRVATPGVVQHVISRFVDKRWELAGDEERREYLRRLGRALATSDWRCLAYCLMSNHLHFAMMAGEQPLASWALRVNPAFSRWLNKRHDRLGPVLANRPANYNIAPDRIARTVAYIHNNPVTAGVVEGARDSDWSSHRAYLGLDEAPRWLDVSMGMQLMGVKSKNSFDKLVVSSVGVHWAEPDHTVVRSKARQRGAVEVGSAFVSESVEFPLLARPFAAVPARIEDVLLIASNTLGVEEMPRRHARGDQAKLKRLVVHAARQAGISGSDAAAALNVSRQRASKIALTPLDEAEQEVARLIVERVRARDA